jgi:hypothetical protein
MQNILSMISFRYTLYNRYNDRILLYYLWHTHFVQTTPISSTFSRNCNREHIYKRLINLRKFYKYTLDYITQVNWIGNEALELIFFDFDCFLSCWVFKHFKIGWVGCSVFKKLTIFAFSIRSKISEIPKKIKYATPLHGRHNLSIKYQAIFFIKKNFYYLYLRIHKFIK